MVGLGTSLDRLAQAASDARQRDRLVGMVPHQEDTTSSLLVVKSDVYYAGRVASCFDLSRVLL